MLLLVVLLAVLVLLVTPFQLALAQLIIDHIIYLLNTTTHILATMLGRIFCTIYGIVCLIFTSNTPLLFIFLLQSSSF